jgi:hypothetical protein
MLSYVTIGNIIARIILEATLYMTLAQQFLHHILNTASLQTYIQTSLSLGHHLEDVVITTAHKLGYQVTFDDLSTVMNHHPALADKIMSLLPAPMLELDETQLEMIAGGAGTTPINSQADMERISNLRESQGK